MHSTKSAPLTTTTAAASLEGRTDVPPRVYRPAKAVGKPAAVRRKVGQDEAWLLHRRLHRASWGTVERTFNVTVPPMPPCHICKTCQAKRIPHPPQAARALKAGQLTHADTWGPFLSAIYYEGCRYIVVFSDHYSKYRFHRCS